MARLSIPSLKYVPDDTELWVRRHNGPGCHLDAGYTVATDEQGNVHVGGVEQVPDRYLVLKYDPDGTLLWSDRFASRLNVFQWTEIALGLGPDGAAYFGGSVLARSGSFLVRKYEPPVAADTRGLRDVISGCFSTRSEAIFARGSLYQPGRQRAGTGVNTGIPGGKLNSSRGRSTCWRTPAFRACCRTPRSTANCSPESVSTRPRATSS